MVYQPFIGFLAVHCIRPVGFGTQLQPQFIKLFLNYPLHIGQNSPVCSKDDHIINIACVSNLNSALFTLGIDFVHILKHRLIQLEQQDICRISRQRGSLRNSYQRVFYTGGLSALCVHIGPVKKSFQKKIHYCIRPRLAVFRQIHCTKLIIHISERFFKRPSQSIPDCPLADVFIKPADIQFCAENFFAVQQRDAFLQKGNKIFPTVIEMPEQPIDWRFFSSKNLHVHLISETDGLIGTVLKGIRSVCSSGIYTCGWIIADSGNIPGISSIDAFPQQFVQHIMLEQQSFMVWQSFQTVRFCVFWRIKT